MLLLFFPMALLAFQTALLDFQREGAIDSPDILNEFHLEPAYLGDIRLFRLVNQDIELNMLFVQINDPFHLVANLIKLNPADQPDIIIFDADVMIVVKNEPIEISRIQQPLDPNTISNLHCNLIEKEKTFMESS